MFPNEQNPESSEPPKRNSGHTGPTSETGQATSARNATRHGMCATTLIMDNEVEADWLDLLQTWLDGYQNPAESTLLYSFVLKTAQAEWHRLRVQREYDFHLFGHGTPPIAAWQPHEIKNHDLILRYLTAAERRFQREYRLLEHHWKTHHKTKSEPGHQIDPAGPDPPATCPKSAMSTAKPANQSTHKATTTRRRPIGNPSPSFPESIHPTTPPIPSTGESDHAGTLPSSAPIPGI